MLADMQERLEYIHSLQNTVCMNYREMTEQELTLKDKVCRDKSESYVINNHISRLSYGFFYTAVTMLLFVFYI